MATIIDHSIFLGGPSDPQPVFRDCAVDGGTWPAGAVMAITFAAERFSHLAPTPGEELPQTDYFGNDGWPIDLATEVKAALPEAIKREFQVLPWGWRSWGRWDWAHAREFPENLERARTVGPIAAAVGNLTSGLGP